MRLEPDLDEAAGEHRAVTTLARNVLARAALPVPDEAAMGYPGLVAVAHDAQRLPADATREQRAVCAAASRAALAAARASAQRARGLGCPAWAVDLPPVELHLRTSLDRALAQIPPRPDRTIDVHVADWADTERAVFHAAATLLAEAWPQMLAELSVCVRQVALLRGYGITGFSDFAVLGAVFINVERLHPGARDGLPGPVRLAENLVHEGAHNRCFSAAMADPFLHTIEADARVVTPLRADPRPLWGLFQQLVVLCRCAELYRRIGPDAAVQTRRKALITHALHAVDTLRSHADQLTDHGHRILTEAIIVLDADTAAAR